jgi:hypothetical protein
VTGWSLPFLFDVPCYVAEQVSSVQATLLKEQPKPAGQMRGAPAKLAYLIAWGTQSAASALADLFRQDVRVHSYDKGFKLNGANFPAGTLVVKLKDNPANLHERMTKLATEHGVDVHSTDTAWVEDGPNFGSSNVNYLPRPRVAIAYNQPVSGNSVGWLRYLIEQRYGYPVTTIRADQLRGADLSRYNVLILPDTFGGYTGQLGDGASVREWVQRGGTLIGLAGATAWLADEKVNLLATKREKRDRSAAAGKEPVSTATGRERSETPADPVEKAIEPTDEFPSATSGAILRVRVDRSHWLGFGYGDTTTVLVDSNRIFSLVKLDRGTNVAVYLPEDKFFASGFMWDDARKQLPNKAFLIHSRVGRGNVVGFAEDPNYRAFMDGLNVMFLNAVFFGPGH